MSMCSATASHYFQVTMNLYSNTMIRSYFYIRIYIFAIKTLLITLGVNEIIRHKRWKTVGKEDIYVGTY